MEGSILHFINSGYNAAHYNMALDEHLLLAKKGLFLCVYGWSIPAISFGYGQTAQKELNLDKIREDGFHFVRRLTGGRAVLHDAEITYSIAADIGGIFGDDLNSAYRAIGLGLQRTLEVLGVPCDIEKGNTRDVRAKEAASLPCFASTARYELKVNGKKVVGSAQRREKNRFLQHGSLIIEDKRNITDYLNLPADQKKAYQRVLKQEATSLKEVMGKTFDYENLAAAFRKGFSESFGMRIADHAVCGEDCAAIRKLETKYFSDEWNRVRES